MGKKTIAIVNQIENKWYDKNPIDDKLCKQIKGWLTQENDNKEQLKLKGVSMKYFVRSYKKAFYNFLCDAVETVNDQNEKVGNYINNKSNYSGISKYLQEKNSEIEIDGFIFSLVTRSFSGHLGNFVTMDSLGLIGGTKYNEIYEFLALITDCNKDNNRELALLFLDFAKSARAFKKSDLIKINKKFENFPDSITERFSKQITCIALLYVFLEPARRIEIFKTDKNSFIIRKNQLPTHAVSMIVTLKLLRDGEINLEDVFSPDSKYVYFTKARVNSSIKSSPEKLKEQQNTLASAAKVSSIKPGRFFHELHKDKKVPYAESLKRYILNPDESIKSESDDEYDDKDIDTDKLKSEQCTIV